MAKRETGVRARTVKRPDARTRQAKAASDDRLRQLLHELQIHSEEITVQNEQLLQAQAELEQARDRYADLYDFAPVGYVAIDLRATIVEINLAGAALLGRPRSFVLRMPFATLLVDEHLEVLRRFLIATRSTADGATVSTDVRVRRHPERTLRLVARPLGLGRGADRLLAAMFDVSEQRHLEAERAAALKREHARTQELAREVATRTRAEERVKASLQRLVTVQEEERRRIARNLHDSLGQQLTALRLSIGALKDGQSSSADLRERLEAIDQIAANIDRDVDVLAWDLRPPTLDDVGLNAALDNIVRDWSQAQDIVAEFQSSEAAIRLSGDIESHFYRIVQEALNNVAKHAGANHVSVLLEHRADEVVLIIEDDGCGFEVDATAKRRRGMGLTGMEERAALIGGELEIESAPGKGTTIFVRVPIRVSLSG